jgi:hypothetical protein
MSKKFQKSWLYGLWDYYIWSGKKSFFACAWQGQQTLTARGAKILNYAIWGFCTIVVHIMLGTYVPNLRGKWWVEHTQMHSRRVQNISITLATLVEFFVISNFHETKISTADMKVQVYSKFSKRKFWKKVKSPISMRTGFWKK